MENIKITQEEINELLEIQTTYQSLSQELGNLEINKLQIQNKHNELIELYNQLTFKEQELGKQLSSKYGDGTIDIENGEFIPTT
jgi:predicted nuclease with TOPRIM domain